MQKSGSEFSGEVIIYWGLSQGDRSKQFQETHKITAAKLSLNVKHLLCIMDLCRHAVIHSNFAAEYCVSFLELFGPIAGVIFSLRNHELKQLEVTQRPF